MEIPTRKVHGAEAREAMLEGINELANVVGSTMGARGRNVIYEGHLWQNRPLVVNDGVTIAREFYDSDPVKNLGIQLVKNAAIRTNDVAGDGTTGATVLSRAIVSKGWELIKRGINPVLLRNQIDEASKMVLAKLKEKSVKVETPEQVKQVAIVAMQDQEVGARIGQAMWDIGKDGAVSIQNGIKTGVEIEKAGGMRIKSGIAGGVLTSVERFEAKYGPTRVLVLNDPIHDHEFESKWLAFARKLIDASLDPESGQVIVKEVKVPRLLIICESLTVRILQFMNDARNKDLVNWIWVKPPTFGERRKDILLDICALTGAKMVDKEDGIVLGDKFELEGLGYASSVVGNKTTLTICRENAELPDSYLDRCNEIKGLIEGAESETEQHELRQRYAALTGGVASIKVCLPTEQDTNELKLRIEDAVNATRSAMEEGIVSGGGVALKDAMAAVSGMVTDGAAVLKAACEAPIRQILHNAGYEEIKIRTVLANVGEGEGVNVVSGKEVNMMTEGVIDPLKVVRTALENAVSVAGLLLTSEYSLTCEKNEMAEFKKMLKP